MISYTYNKTINQNKLLKEINNSNMNHKPVSTEYNDGVCIINFQNSLSGEDKAWLDLTVESHNPIDMDNFLYCKIEDAMHFGRDLMIKFAAQNVAMGITQAGKTKEVLAYLSDIKNAMDTGSLYTVLDEVVELKTAGLPPELAPFVTEERLDSIKNDIEEYLGL